MTSARTQRDYARRFGAWSLRARPWRQPSRQRARPCAGTASVASLSESQKLARALRPEPARLCEREARTEGSAGSPHSKGRARGESTGSGSPGLAGGLPPPSLGAAGRNSSPSDVSKVAFVEFCCGSRSFLGQEAEKRNTRYIRFTKLKRLTL